MSGPSNHELAEKFKRAAGADAPGRLPAVASAMTPLRKFTVLLNHEDAEDFDALVLAARRALKRWVDKSQLVRVLIALLMADDQLRAELFERVGRELSSES